MRRRRERKADSSQDSKFFGRRRADPLTGLVYLNRGQTVVRGEHITEVKKRRDKKESYDKLNLAISATLSS